MKRIVTPTTAAVSLWVVTSVLSYARLKHVSLPSEAAMLLLCWVVTKAFFALPKADYAPIGNESSDPWQRISQNRAKVVKGLVLISSVTLLFFADIVFLGHSMISAPWFNLGQEALPPSAGFGHTVDPWAGFLIEGPGIYMTGAAFAAGELPFWNPFEACGTPYAANGEMAVFSVLQLPLHLAPSLQAWDYFALIRILLVGIGSWLCAFAMGRSSRAALIPGFGMAFGGVFVLFSNLVHLNTALFVPWVILAIECFVSHVSIKRWSLLALVIALALNGGNPQPLACCLVLYAPVVLLRSMRDWRALLGFGTAALVGGALSAFTLLPLADLLSRSENRTFFLLEITGTASHLIDWFVPGGPLLGEAKEGVSGPPWWRIGTIPCVLALFSISRRSKYNHGIVVGIGIYLSLTLFPTLSAYFHNIPLIGGLKWTKYASGVHFLVLLLAAGGFDRIQAGITRKACVLPSLITIAIVLHGAYFRNRIDEQTWLALSLTAVAIVTILATRKYSQLLLLLPLFVVLEANWYRPNYPERSAEPEAPVGLPAGTNIESTEWLPMDKRTMGYRDAVAPLLSGLQGWYDIRSVGAFPLTSYHKMMAPYMNCGPWPPYMLLGASREIVLSPYFDLTGVNDVVFRKGDFEDMVRERREDLLETNQFVRFGEFQRALDYSSITTSNLVAPNAFEGSFVLLPSSAFSLDLNLFARSARIGFRCESPTNDPFVVTAGFGEERRRIDSQKPEHFEIKDATSPVTLNMSLDSKNPVKFILTEWWVDRHITKGKDDFIPMPTLESESQNLVILHNKYPLPVARVIYQGRIVPASELRNDLDHFVATGDGWDHRSELLVTPRSGMARDSYPPFIADRKEQPMKLERQGWNRMRVQGINQAPGWLSLAVSYDPGWSATVNGKDVGIELGNGAFMTVPLHQAGTKEIEFTYSPPKFKLGLLVSCITGLTLLVLNAWTWRRGLRQRNSTL